MMTLMVFGIASSSWAKPLLKVGSRGVAVVELQRTLRAIEYYQGPVTGYYGHLTRQATRRFQTDHGLVADGIVGPKTLEVLQSLMRLTADESGFSRTLSRGSRGSAVVELQQYLQVLGYFYSPITGYYGAMTQAAVRQFQVTLGLKVTGRADGDTLAALEAAVFAVDISKPPLTRDFAPPYRRGDFR